MIISFVREQMRIDRHTVTDTLMPLLFTGIPVTMRNWKLISLIVSIICILTSIIATAAPGVTQQSVKNISYHPAIWKSSDQLEVRSVRLVNGIYEKGQKNVDLDYELLQTGRVIFGDINGDGKKDAVVILYHMKDDLEASEIAIVLDVKGVPIHVATRYFGVGTEIMDAKIEKTVLPDPRTGKLAETGLIRVEVSNAKYCEGQGKSVSYRLVNDKLIGPDPFGKNRY
ncbi:MAG TPA: hypothetical protein VN367_01690 [Chlorobaculum sp.]|nr:hypothetical protein [Chlorobaculum sp.]